MLYFPLHFTITNSTFANSTTPQKAKMKRNQNSLNEQHFNQIIKNEQAKNDQNESIKTNILAFQPQALDSPNKSNQLPEQISAHKLNQQSILNSPKSLANNDNSSFQRSLQNASAISPLLHQSFKSTNNSANNSPALAKTVKVNNSQLTDLYNRYSRSPKQLTSCKSEQHITSLQTKQKLSVAEPRQSHIKSNNILNQLLQIAPQRLDLVEDNMSLIGLKIKEQMIQNPEQKQDVSVNEKFEKQLFKNQAEEKSLFTKKVKIHQKSHKQLEHWQRLNGRMPEDQYYEMIYNPGGNNEE